MLVVRWMMWEVAKATQLRLFDREMDRGLPPCHPSLPRYHRPVLHNLSQTGALKGFGSFSSTQDVIHLSWQFVSGCIYREHTGRGVCAETWAGSGWLCRWMAECDELWTTALVSVAMLAGLYFTVFLVLTQG